jgi:uncharacterized membrane protein YphA (DoxX/SURF4 family)
MLRGSAPGRSLGLAQQEMIMSDQTTQPVSQRRILNAVLWLVQLLLAAFFIYAGFSKLTVPIAQLSMAMPWTAEHPALVTFTGVVDLLGGIGVILPALTRIRPQLGVLAAAGLAALQLVAMVFHVSRGEAQMTPLNVVLLALILFALWGRAKAVPIAPRV